MGPGDASVTSLKGLLFAACLQRSNLTASVTPMGRLLGAFIGQLMGRLMGQFFGQLFGHKVGKLRATQLNMQFFQLELITFGCIRFRIPQVIAGRHGAAQDSPMQCSAVQHSR
jgi:hypothetical protein